MAKKQESRKRKYSAQPLLNIIIRYFLVIATSYNGLFIFYYIFTPLTVYPIFFILNLFFSANLNGNIINISGFTIELIPACIAGSAYYLLFVLNMIVPNLSIKKRTGMILFAFTSLLLLNLLRILGLVLLALYSLAFFDIAHKFFWYFLNIILVTIIWFAEVLIFKVKGIPFYTDVIYLYNKARGR